MKFNWLLSIMVEIIGWSYNLLSSFFWCLVVLPFYFVSLRDHGYTNIRLFKPINWHFSCRYLTASKDGRKYFIKCARHFLIYNEVVSIKIISKISPSSVTKLSLYKLRKNSMVNYIVVPFLCDYTPLDEIQGFTESQFNELSIALRKLLVVMESTGIVHRDISPSNLFINNDDVGKVVLIDFAMASGDFLLPMRYFFINWLVYHSLGCEYRPSKGVWNDNYSIEQIIQQTKRKITN